VFQHCDLVLKPGGLLSVGVVEQQLLTYRLATSSFRSAGGGREALCTDLAAFNSSPCCPGPACTVHRVQMLTYRNALMEAERLHTGDA